jgi:hypothetical protein
MLLMNMNIAVAFICLRNLLDRPCLRAFYCGIDEEVEAYYRASSKQIQDTYLDELPLKLLLIFPCLDIRQSSSRPLSQDLCQLQDRRRPDPLDVFHHLVLASDPVRSRRTRVGLDHA